MLKGPRLIAVLFVTFRPFALLSLGEPLTGRGAIGLGERARMTQILEYSNTGGLNAAFNQLSLDFLAPCTSAASGFNACSAAGMTVQSCNIILKPTTAASGFRRKDYQMRSSGRVPGEFVAEYNGYAIWCNGLYVLDIESHGNGPQFYGEILTECNGGAPFNTLTMKSGRGGIHMVFLANPEFDDKEEYYYREHHEGCRFWTEEGDYFIEGINKPMVRPFNTRDGHVADADVRAGESFIFGPGSRYVDACGTLRAYSVLHNVAPIEAPTALMEYLKDSMHGEDDSEGSP